MTRYDIPSQNLSYLSHRIDKLNDRAAKLGVEPITIAETARHTRPEQKDEITGLVERAEYVVITVEIDGGRIHLADWRFLGTVEHTPAGNILRAVPGEEMPEDYRTARRDCDHCGTDRRRRDTYLVQHTDGTIKQVGRTCTADYLGGADAQKLAAWMQSLYALESDAGDEDIDRTPRGRGGVTPREIVETAVATVRMDHGRYHKSGSKGATVWTVTDWLHGGPPARKLMDAGFSITADDIDRAEALLAWIANEYDGNGYIANLRISAENELIGLRKIGLLVSLPIAWDNAQRSVAERAEREARWVTEKAEREAARAAEMADAADAPTGRVEITGEVIKLDSRETDWGTIYKMIIKTDEGWKLWVSQPQSLFDIPIDEGLGHRSVEVGERVTMAVTVEPSPDDPKFAFGKRPSKASRVQ